MRIISSCKMGSGTFEAKFIPLSKLSNVEKIYVLRERVGPAIEKLEYIIIPNYINRFKAFKFLIPLVLAKHAIKNRCNLIIGYHIIPHAFFAFFASMLSGIPFACAQTGIFIQSQSKNKGFGFFLKWMFRKALFINVPGQVSKSFWTDFGVDPQKINTLHSTIDTNRFYNKNLGKDFDFIILSRLSEEKRIEYLLKIFSELKNEGHTFSVCIAGAGPRKDYLESLAKDLDIDAIVNFIGFVNNPEEWFNKSKIFLLSSQTEGFPTALMQAMACELLCISTNVGNISDTIESGINGFLINYGDWFTYKETLNTILNNFNSEEISVISTRARESVVLYHSYDFAMQQWNNVFSQYFSS